MRRARLARNPRVSLARTRRAIFTLTPRFSIARSRRAGISRQAPLVAIPAAEFARAETPRERQRRRAAAGGEASVLASLMAEATETDTVVLAIGGDVRPVADMVILEIAARGACRRGAAPAVADEDGIGGEIAGVLRRVPRLDEVLEQGEEADPVRDAAVGDGKHPSGEAGGGETGRNGEILRRGRTISGRELALGNDDAARRHAA